MDAMPYYNPEPHGKAALTREGVTAEFGRRLQKRLVELRWSQSDLMRRVNARYPDGKPIGRDSISVYVRGKALPNAARLKMIADALDCTPADLVPRESVPSVDQHNPPFALNTLEDGTAWLRVNQAVPLAVALEVGKLLAGSEKSDT